MYSTHHPALDATGSASSPTVQSQSQPRIISEGMSFAANSANTPSPQPLQARPYAPALPDFQFSFQHHPPSRQKSNNSPSSPAQETARSISDPDLDLHTRSKLRYSSSVQRQSKDSTTSSSHHPGGAAKQTAGQLRTSLNGYEPPSKRQLSVKERFARPSLYAGLSAQELAGSPRERWDAMMLNPKIGDNVEVVEDLALVVTKVATKDEGEKENNVATTPKSTRHVARRSISQPLILQAPYPTPVSAKAVRRVNSISVGQAAKEEAKSGDDERTSISMNNDATEFPRPSSDEDVAALIAASGSAEAALKKILEEKQSIAARSEQLWRLVEKQRAMMLDLNKNLERALKEKERYRLKLKETLGNNATTLARTDIIGNGSRAGSIDSETLPGTPQNKRVNKIQAQDSPQTPPRSGSSPPQTRKPSSIVDDSPLSSHRRNESMLSDAGSVTLMEATPVKISPLTRATAKNMSGPQTPQDVPPPRLIMPTSTSSNQKPQSRKNPPTPLNLSAIPRQNDQTPKERNGFYTDSDYSDSPTQLSTPAERGRRRTRTDDENLRKPAMPREAQRSTSTKSSKNSMAQSAHEISLAKLEPLESAEDISQSSRSIFMATPGLPASPRPRPQPMMARSDGSATTTLSYAPFAPLQSPGLPMSPRPIDRPLNAPAPRAPKTPLPMYTPLSQAFTMAGLPLSPREPRQFLQLPSLGPIDMPSFSSTVMDDVSSMKSRSTSIATEDAASVTRIRDDTNSMSSQHQAVESGLVSDAYPGLLLPPSALKLVEIRISCTTDETPRHDSPVQLTQEYTDAFSLDVVRRSNQRKLWTTEKVMSELPHMHHSIKSTCNLPAMLPQDSPFANEVRVNAQLRQAALTQYFKVLLETPLDDAAALIVCRYLSTHVIDGSGDVSPSPSDHDSAVAMGSSTFGSRRKSGFLSKKSSTFGNWKSRYFALDGPVLKYYLEPGSEMLGSINLPNARIARERNPGSSDYKHVFLILEQKRDGFSSSAKHVLCDVSDEARDEWIEAMLPHTVPDRPTKPQLLSPQADSDGHQPQKLSKAPNGATESSPHLQAVGYDSTVAAPPPFIGTLSSRNAFTSQTALLSPAIDSPSSSNLSIPQSSNTRGPSFDETSQATALPEVASGKKEQKRGHSKKRSLFGFRTNKSSDDSGSSSSHKHERSLSRHRSTASKAFMSSKVVFGAPLAEAAKYFPPQGVDVLLPAPVFRCIEYLEHRQAATEEGIFRLSGANLTIKALKEKFNSEGDVKLIQESQYYDVHAVASLLKAYLRDLPESVLTQAMQTEFINAMDLESQASRLTTVSTLIQRLPEANRELLATLTRFLIGVVEQSDKNKMSVRNISIVFAPTLNVPNELIALLLTSYSAAFNDPSFPISNNVTIPPATSASMPSTPVTHATHPPQRSITPGVQNISSNTNNDLHVSKYSPSYRQQQPFSPIAHENYKAYHTTAAPSSPRYELDNSNATYAAPTANAANRDTTIESLRARRVAGRI